MKPSIAGQSGVKDEGEGSSAPGSDSTAPSGQNDSSTPQEQTIVLILDLTPSAWVTGVSPVSQATEESKLQLYNLYNILYRFLRTYAFMSARSRCCIIATHSAGSRILYEAIISKDWLNSCFLGVNTQNEHVDVNLKSIWHAMLDFIRSGAHGASGDPQLTTAISMGLLCRFKAVLDKIKTQDLNRLKQTGVGYGRRILLFDVSKEDGYKSQYIGLMNAAFTASKSKVSINTCAFGQSSRILEQLSDITNAKYLSLPKILKSEEDLHNYDQSIVQLLTFWFLPSHAVSEHLSIQLPFDFSNTAVCYCHYNTVDIAFICPCCFAVYCSEKEDNGKYRIFCFVCNSRLTRQLVKQKTAGDADLSRN